LRSNGGDMQTVQGNLSVKTFALARL
jgi:hypothetical protein